MNERRSTDLRPWTPDSLSRRQGIDRRAALTSRAVLLLQVAHPVVGAGVADHSGFLSDRWGRIRSTAASARRFSGLEGMQAAIDEGERLRRVHRDISGVDELGRNRTTDLLRLTTGGYLPPVLRARLGIDWSPECARRFDRVVAVSNLLDRALPGKARYPLSGAGAAGLRH